MQQHYDKYSLHSANMYQIFTYVKNMDKTSTGNVAGLLLYAKTQETITPKVMYSIGGNRIGARTLDLNMRFNLIAEELDKIAEELL